MVYKGFEFKLSCFKCGGTKFENTNQDYTIIEDEYYLDNEKSKVKCVKCGFYLLFEIK